MIHSFKHRGLKHLYKKGDRNKINPLQIDKVELILQDLDAAETIDHLRRPGYRLHRLRGKLNEYFAIDVSNNWRLFSVSSTDKHRTLIWWITIELRF